MLHRQFYSSAAHEQGWEASRQGGGVCLKRVDITFRFDFVLHDTMWLKYVRALTEKMQLGDLVYLVPNTG